jgi:hypothetical protein
VPLSNTFDLPYKKEESDQSRVVLFSHGDVFDPLTHPQQVSYVKADTFSPLNYSLHREIIPKTLKCLFSQARPSLEIDLMVYKIEK